MEPEGSSLHSQVPSTCPYPQPARSSPCPFIPNPDDNLDIILPSTPASSKLSLSPRFSQQNPTKTKTKTRLMSTIRATSPAHLILLDIITRKFLGEKYRSLSSSIYNFHHSLVTSSLLCPNILLNTLFSSTLSLRSSLNVSDRVSHPYKQQAKL
jgi:hypothetical protein